MTAPTTRRKPVSVDEFVEKVVAAAPPLSAQTRATLRDLLAREIDEPVEQNRQRAGGRRAA